MTYGLLRKILHPQDFSDTQERIICGRIPHSPIYSQTHHLSFSFPDAQPHLWWQITFFPPSTFHFSNKTKKKKTSKKLPRKPSLLEIWAFPSRNPGSGFWCLGDTRASKLSLLDSHSLHPVVLPRRQQGLRRVTRLCKRDGGSHRHTDISLAPKEQLRVCSLPHLPKHPASTNVPLGEPATSLN